MKKIFLLLIMVISCSMYTYSQDSNSELSLSGTVIDENGYELIGVTVTVKGKQTIGTVTDVDGKFRLNKIPKGSTILFSYIGYNDFEVKLQESKERYTVYLKPKVDELDEVVVVGQGTQRKVSVTGAITNIDPAQLQVPSTSVSNMLGGRVPGIVAVTRSGEPGNDFSEFWVRGISTFGASQGALILIDGIEGNLNDLDPADIESFSVLKDASATAVYGVRGANGVVLVTTKRGVAEKLSVSVKSNVTLSYSPRMPEYVDAYNYAELANEALTVRGKDPLYSDVELHLFKTGLDPDLYPNVNWGDQILKDNTWNHQHHISIKGGGSNARYYMSLGLLNKEAVFKQDKSANKYDTNVNYHKYNFRANIDANITKTTVLGLGLETVIVTQNSPGYGDNNNALWGAQANLTPVVVPVRYSTGELAAYGTNWDQCNPYVILNHTGYKKNFRNSTILRANVQQNLDMVTKGLSASALFAFTANNQYLRIRNKMPDLYMANGRLKDGSLDLVRKVNKQDPSYGKNVYVDRKYYFEGRINYERRFGENHRVTGLMHYYMEDYIDSNANDDLSSIPKRYQAYSGRATYSYKDTYFVEGNVGYTGSEAFQSGSQFGWFPAISAGWVPTQYEWVRKNVPFISFFKIRASMGKVGNDRVATNRRFPYLTIIGSDGKGDANDQRWQLGSGLTETQVGSDNLRWEAADKYDVGVDAKFFNEKVDLTIDYFLDKRTGIFQERQNIPEEVGVTTVPFANVGTMKSWGVDGNISFSQSINKDLSFVLRANFTYAKNEVTKWEQSGVRYPYQSYQGKPYGAMRGLIALGYFTDMDDIRSNPKQTFMTNVLPGDIKYKDVNNDGQINDDDIVPLSYSNIPQIQYGFAGELRWKNWTLNVFFEGVSKVNFFYGGTGFYPFAYGNAGNILTIVNNQKDRWTPASYSGTKDTENPNARFPRLTYGINENNNRASTHWLADASYLRLKNVQISYDLSRSWLQNKIVKGATLSLIGDNLACWDKVDLWDPGQASQNGAVYPLQRTFTFQVNLTF